MRPVPFSWHAMSVKNTSSKYISRKNVMSHYSHSNISNKYFAQVVVAKSYTLFRRIPSASCSQQERRNICSLVQKQRCGFLGGIRFEPARMGEDRGVHRVLVGKSAGKRPLGRPRRRWEDNIKMDLQEVGGGLGDWMELAQDRDRWQALVGAVRDFRVP